MDRQMGSAREFSSSEAGLDWRIPLLIRNPEHTCSFLADIPHPITEALVVPIQAGGEPVGSIWVMLHDASRSFDSEDLRLLNSLGRFASAYHGISTAHLVWQN